MSRKSKKQRMAELLAPPPPAEFTLAELDRRSRLFPETKARQRKAISNAHQALREILQTLEAWSKHPNLVGRVTVDHIHKAIRRRLKLPDPPPAQPAKTLADLDALLFPDEDADAAA